MNERKAAEIMGQFANGFPSEAKIVVDYVQDLRIKLEEAEKENRNLLIERNVMSEKYLEVTQASDSIGYDTTAYEMATKWSKNEVSPGIGRNDE